MACDRDPKRTLINAGEKDLISDLPNNVSDNIMDRLPLQEAARLCILSKKWKLIWMSYPNLKLDNQFCRDMLSNKVFHCYEFNRILSNVLLYHNGPIPKFYLAIPKMDPPLHILQYPSALSKSGMSYMCDPDLSTPIAHLSRNGIRELTLQNLMRSSLKLPSHLFSCVKLEKLKLCQFEVNIPPSFESFKSITRLELEGVTFTGRTLESFISSCPSLETLSVKGIIDGGSLVIKAPNLKLIAVEGIFMSICLEGCLGLSCVTIDYNSSNAMVFSKHHEKARELVEFLSRSCKLKELYLRNNSFMKFLGAAGIRAMCLYTFDHLRKLQLSPDSGSVASAIRIFQNCPNLKELKISITPSAVDHDEITCNPGNLFQRLRTVYVIHSSGLNMELKFIKFLLAHAPVLEKLYIARGVNLTPIQSTRLTTSLLQFPRASNKAEILYIKLR